MSHEDKGNYAAKHPEGMELNSAAAELIEEQSSGDKLSCADAHKISAEGGINPEALGTTVDLMEIRIVRCQLGFFGYPGYKRSIVKPAAHIPDAIKGRILQEVKDNRVSCLSLWNIADGMGISKLDVSAVCEALELKVTCCQLGTF